MPDNNGSLIPELDPSVINGDLDDFDNPVPVAPDVQQEKPRFQVTISDDDYLRPDELDALNHQKDPSVPEYAKSEKPKFEVHIDDDDYMSQPVDDAGPEYKGEIYFSNVKPVRTPPVGVSAQPVKPAEKDGEGKKKKKKKKKSSYGALALFLAIIIVLTSTVSVFGISCMNDIVAFGRSEDVVPITIPRDATTDDIIDLLYEKGLIKQKKFCKLFYMLETKLKELAGSSTSEPVYLSGVYYVEKNMGFEGYLYEFRETQVGTDTITVTIPEGWSIYQVFERLEKFGVCSKSKLLSSINGTDFEYKFAKEIPDDSNRTSKLEGYLFPNTYEFYVNSDPNSVLRKFFDEFETNVWTDKYQKQADKLGYTRDEIMTIASIIQREAADESQMKDISSVIHNRLKHSASWPTLDCDSTKDYVTNYVTPNVSASQANLFASAYSTYDNQGLPPGPICSPGIEAIEAALYPNDTSYYFFRHDKNGKIYLAKTQAEHDANANLVLKANNS